MSRTYQHVGKRIYFDCAGQYRILESESAKLTLRLLQSSECEDECCSQPRNKLRQIIRQNPKEMSWVDKTEYVFTIEHTFPFDSLWSHQSEVQIARTLTEYFSEDCADIWPD